MPPDQQGGSISPYEFGKFVGEVNTGIADLGKGQKRIDNRIDDTNTELGKLRDDLTTHLTNHPNGPTSNGRFGKYKQPAQTMTGAGAIVGLIEAAKWFMQ